MTIAARRRRRSWASRGVPHIHWAIPLGFAAWAWTQAGEPERTAGLFSLEALVLLAWPVALAAVVFGPSAAVYLVPRETRKRWYARHNRRALPKRLQRALLKAYRYRCMFCPERTGLQFDHYCPRSHGGPTNLWNMVVLCGYHNRVKSNYWVYPGSRKAYYRPFDDANNPTLAGQILACERRQRHNPLRWLWLFWVLAL